MQYYSNPQMNPAMGMNPAMQGGMGLGGMGIGANQGMMGQNPMLGMNGMGMQGMGSYGQAWRNLGYDYTPPSLAYKPEATWGAWDLANAQYSGGRLERGFFDNIISTLTNFFANRHLSEDSARDAHRRVYYQGEGTDAGNKTLGGAAAYQAYLIWDRDHYSAYHAMPSQENRERLVGLAVAELFSLWDRVQPRSTRATTEEAAQYAAATAKYLFDRHYDLPHNPHPYHRAGSRFSNYRGDDSDSEDEHYHRRRNMYGQPYNGVQAAPNLGAGAMMNGMMPGGIPGQGMGMGVGMQPGMMGGMQGMGMGQMGGMGMQSGMMGQMGMGGMNGMAQMGGMGIQPGMVGLQQGVPPHGSIGESQAAPGMHPYHYGAQSGVAWGNQPIDQMGNPTFLGGPQRSWYGYGQPKYF
ncbi:hypothetical protein J010_06626 [Cryptococcus neoformans]|nr:hypothetical protein C355_06640 [Cryptococcus neoformans var. grubii Th84]OXH00655.1 hypothetical protein J010_06626 [Cryptococcus neoformans var. grubii]OXH22364.1 hypothetical protein J009_06614 [Cryptococcus neoformans var. grubii]OXH42549.1 hypothetical protein J004_06649 [Cryptococcus neoformans var. grubii]OXH43054.1 hypothetical protein J003_06612 [Cryptococcus neoformans var. grubii]